MIFRRFAVAIGLLFAFFGAQLPEFTQQYRQRLGGAIDELSAVIARFDGEAATQSLTRAQGIARLEGNADPLAQERGTAVEDAVARKDRLDRQRQALESAGPLSEYAVLADGLDRGVARQALAAYVPAVPTTTAGFLVGAIAFAIGWLLTHLAALPFRVRPRPRAAATSA